MSDFGRLQESLTEAEGALAVSRDAIKALVDENNGLIARLAEAHRETDARGEAVREKCLEIIEDFIPDRAVAVQWSYQGALAVIADRIRAAKL